MRNRCLSFAALLALPLLSACSLSGLLSWHQAPPSSEAVVTAVQAAVHGSHASVTDDRKLLTSLDTLDDVQIFCDRAAGVVVQGHSGAFVRPVWFTDMTRIGGDLYARVRSGLEGDERGFVVQGDDIAYDRPVLHFYRKIGDQTYRLDEAIPYVVGYGCPDSGGFRIHALPQGGMIVEALRASGLASTAVVWDGSSWITASALIDDALGLPGAMRGGFTVHVSRDAFSFTEDSDTPAIADKRAEIIFDAHTHRIADVVMHTQ